MTKKRRAERKPGGQGIMEGVCGTFVLVFVFVFLIMLGVNVYTVATTDSTLRLVAMESAKLREEYTFFLGQKRNDIDDKTARKNATDFAVALANANGLAVTPGDVNFNDSITAQQAGTKCTIRLRALKLPFGGGVFPLMLERAVSSVVARMNVPAPAMVDLCAQGEGGALTIRLPSYGAYRPIQTATNGNGRLALDRANLFVAQDIPGIGPMGTVSAKIYLGVGVAASQVLGPIRGDGSAYVNPQLLPAVNQRNIQL